MTQDQRPRKGFEERLLTELKRVVVAQSGVPAHSRLASRAALRRSNVKRRVSALIGIAAALALMLAIVLPALGGENGRSPAYAVTENQDGSVTVQINSIEDADGLEQKLEDAGVPAAVHFLPPGKLCNPRAWQVPEPPPSHERPPTRVDIAQNADGAFIFTIGSYHPPGAPS